MRIPILVSLVFTTAVSAQTATLVTDTAVGVFANTTLKAAKKGTAVVSGTPLSLNAVIRGASSVSTISLADRAGVFGGLKLQHSAQVASASRFMAGTAATTDPNAIRQAPHSYLLTLTGQKFNAFTLTMSSRISGRIRGSVAVDIGADGRIEFQQAADGRTYNRTLGFTGSSVKVRVTIDGVAGAGAGYGISLSLTATNASGCRITSYGRPCPSTTLGARVATVSGNYVMGLHMANGLPSAPLAWVVGLQTATIPLPGSPCSLLTNPLVIVGATADASGNAKLQLQFPTSTKGTAFLQAIPYDPKKNVIMASNGLRVDCL